MGRPKKSPPAPRPLIDVLDEVSPPLTAELALHRDANPAENEESDLDKFRASVAATQASNDYKIEQLERAGNQIHTFYGSVRDMVQERSGELDRRLSTIEARLSALEQQASASTIAYAPDNGITRYNALEAKLDALNATIGAY